jgi:hypothetical protein
MATPREPRIIEDGPDSEHYLHTRLVRTIYRCPLCAFHSGAEAAHEPATSLPPELRDEAAWQQEARAKRSADEFESYKARARRAFEAHRCEAHSVRGVPPGEPSGPDS